MYNLLFEESREQRKFWTQLLIACMLSNQQGMLDIPFEKYKEADNYELTLEHFGNGGSDDMDQRVSIKRKDKL